MQSIYTMFETNPDVLMNEILRIETGEFYYVVRYNTLTKKFDILDTNNPLLIDVQ
jgi:hypothetical protein